MFYSITLVRGKTSYIKTLHAEGGLNEADITHHAAVCFDILVVFLPLRVP